MYFHERVSEEWGTITEDTSDRKVMALWEWYYGWRMYRTIPPDDKRRTELKDYLEWIYENERFK